MLRDLNHYPSWNPLLGKRNDLHFQNNRLEMPFGLPNQPLNQYLELKRQNSFPLLMNNQWKIQKENYLRLSPFKRGEKLHFNDEILQKTRKYNDFKRHYQKLLNFDDIAEALEKDIFGRKLKKNNLLLPNRNSIHFMQMNKFERECGPNPFNQFPENFRLNRYEKIELANYNLNNRCKNSLKNHNPPIFRKDDYLLRESGIFNDFQKSNQRSFKNNFSPFKKIKKDQKGVLFHDNLSSGNEEDNKTVRVSLQKKLNRNLSINFPIEPKINHNLNNPFGSDRTIINRNYPENRKSSVRSNFGMKRMHGFERSTYFNQHSNGQMFQTSLPEHIEEVMKTMSKIIYDRSLRRDKFRLKKDLENSLANIDIKMSHLVGLKNLLSKFMKEETVILKDLDLSNLEILLFCLFLVKKRYLDLEAIQWTPECINKLRNQEMLKRSEQNYKVVLKRAFKTLICTFNTEHSVLGGNEAEFYEYYFGKVSRDYNISIENFKPQKIFNEIKSKNKTKKFEKRKSKKEFASMLKKSSEFMTLLKRYLNDELVINNKIEGIFKDCMKELDRKLPLMIFNWQKKLGNEGDFKKEFIQFLAATLVNDKVKLPWSASEVQRGVSSVLRLFRKA